MAELLLRCLALALLLAGAETLHGMARLRWLVPRLGGRWAQRLSTVSGSMLAFLLIALALPSLPLPSLPLPSSTSLLLLGLALAAFMAAYDAALGRWVFHRSWRSVLQDFNPAHGNLLLLGVIVLSLSPLLASTLRRAL
ncbi:hypothetical protein [Cyanobium sp. ATX 6F1]|uniref:hypothetical protein n=1 Tax=Cyanobium sp. ATX 6F1 TaxID=2823702 RepID=UPI0020CCDB6B|nr:hypothetical protein [Cyanobium sp. ATX 6F1]MCP9915975.1 hypothetical protein [Cyanobium sp. ATX 6F1]